MEWLRNTGSPKSKIEKVLFKQQHTVEKFSFSSFTIKTTMLSVDYEVFGKVQRVFFRKNTKQKAEELGLKGWVKNTRSRSVAGQLEGEMTQVNIEKDKMSFLGG